jgi:hypothetical protein
MTLLALVQRLRKARDRRSAAHESAEFVDATREIDELASRIWRLTDADPRLDHDVALTVARLRAVQDSLADQKLASDQALHAARQTIDHARVLLRRVHAGAPDDD